MKKRLYLFFIIILIISIVSTFIVGCNPQDSNKAEDTIDESTESKQNLPTDEEKPSEDNPAENPSETTEENPSKEEPAQKDNDKDKDKPIVVDPYADLSYKLLKGNNKRKICIDRNDSDTFVIEKSSDKDFVVINIADLQISSVFTDLTRNSVSHKALDEAIKTYNPDLILFSGDQAWLPATYLCYKKLINVLDEYTIPWAMVLGNHDPENMDTDVITSIIQESSWGIFSKGPYEVSGCGNYTINIVEKGTENILHTYFMMDSGTGSEDYEAPLYDYLTPNTDLPDALSIYRSRYTKSTGRIRLDFSYSSINETHIAWYENKVNQITLSQGHIVPSTCVFHIPLPEYYYALKQWIFADEIGKAEMQPLGHFNNYETIGMGRCNHGFFNKVKELGSTKNIIVGHDHLNNYSLVYQGIRLTYGVKCGDGCYWNESGNDSGCTAMIIDENGELALEQHYYNPL